MHILHLFSGLTNETVYLVAAQVDTSLPENQNPKQELEENECISLIRVPVNSLTQELTRMYKEEKCDVHVGLFSLAYGLQLNSTGVFNLKSLDNPESPASKL